MARNYKLIPLEKLEFTRLFLRAQLKDLESATGRRYSVRTFYLGPRKVYGGRRQGTTNKSDAYAAKLAVYQDNDRYGYFDLAYYV